MSPFHSLYALIWHVLLLQALQLTHVVNAASMMKLTSLLPMPLSARTGKHDSMSSNARLMLTTRFSRYHDTIPIPTEQININGIGALTQVRVFPAQITYLCFRRLNHARPNACKWPMDNMLPCVTPARFDLILSLPMASHMCSHFKMYIIHHIFLVTCFPWKRYRDNSMPLPPFENLHSYRSRMVRPYRLHGTITSNMSWSLIQSRLPSMINSSGIVASCMQAMLPCNAWSASSDISLVTLIAQRVMPVCNGATALATVSR